MFIAHALSLQSVTWKKDHLETVKIIFNSLLKNKVQQSNLSFLK